MGVAGEQAAPVAADEPLAAPQILAVHSTAGVAGRAVARQDSVRGQLRRCHAEDMRGVIGKGNNLLRSPVAMDDQHGELIIANLAKHNPPVTLVEADGVATSEYIHSVLATMGAQGSPPGRNPVGLQLNVLVGDPKAGKVSFDAHCASCHSVTGDLKGMAISTMIPARCRTPGYRVRAAEADAAAVAGRRWRSGGNVTVTWQTARSWKGAGAEDDFLVILKLAGWHAAVDPD